MTIEFRFTAKLRFADRRAIDDAERVLRAEGYVSHEDNLIAPDVLVWDGLTLTVDLDGSMPSSCFGLTWCVLATYAKHAIDGAAMGLDFDDAYGFRMRAGAEEDEELTPEEMDALAPRDED